MDQIKIGRFISECRKKVHLTQMQLAERLGITDKAVSKWERGVAMPDSSIMLELCSILQISVTDLLSGEVVTVDNYNKESEKLLIEMIKQKEESDKHLLSLEILIGTFSIIILLGFTFTASFFQMEDWLRIVFIVLGFVIGFVGIMFALRIEQTAGYYACAKCGHKYIPTYTSVFVAMHLGRTRYMRCPECGKRGWHKKVLRKD